MRAYNDAVSVRITSYTGGPVACNGYLLQGEQGCVAVDAPEGFCDWALGQLPQGMKLSDLLLTHQHFDHIGDAAALQRRTGCRIHAFCVPDDELTLAASARSWGVTLPELYTPESCAGQPSADWGGLRWTLFHIPGHSRDGMAYYLASEYVVFTGDILFAGAIGRTDFPGGSSRSLVQGIREHLLKLPPETRVCCGHGPATTIGEELLENPYIS